MVDRAAQPEVLLRSLAETAERARGVSMRLAADQLSAAPTAGGWSPNEILWHIRATADVYGEHISRILDEDQPTWCHVSPRARMKRSRYDLVPFTESFAAFEEQRGALLSRLGEIAPEAWRRTALVRVEKRESQLTLQERVWGMAHHEQIHCAQMEQVAAALEQLDQATSAVCGVATRTGRP